MQKQTIKFSLAEFEPVEEEFEEDYESAKQNRFAKVKIKLFGDGENAHTEPVDFEALKKSADSAYDIPLIAELNPYRNEKDFGGHGVLTGKEFSFGFVKESDDNPIVFEKDENGKTFITLYGLIWKKYFSNIVDIIKSHDNKVEVSVELDIVKGAMSKRGKPIMKQFVLNAITFLGAITTAACKGANAELCFSETQDEFTKDKEEYYREYFSEDIKINNTREAAVNGKWTNPRQKLLSKILTASNKKALLNEAYLFVDNQEDKEITLSDVSYPHHIIKNKELILHINGVQSAFSRLAQMGKVEGEAKEHLIRHYKELGLNTENFSEFNITKEQFELYFANSCGKEETMEAEIEVKEIVEEETCVEHSEEAEFADEEKETEEEKISDDEKAEEEQLEETEEKMEEETESEPNESEVSEIEEGKEEAEENLSEKIQEMSILLEKLQKENEAYLSQIQEMSDYAELKQYKENMEASLAQQQEMARMEEVLSKMEEKGIAMSEETKQDLIANRTMFSNIDAWSNYVKAYAFDNCEKNEEGIVTFATNIATHKENEEDTKLGVWASLRKNTTM